MQNFSGITKVAAPFRGVLLDAYGVFWGGNEYGLLPGSLEAMASLVKSGKIVGVLSNATQLAHKEIHKFIPHGLKLGEHFHFLITSGELTRKMFLHEIFPFETHRKTVFVFGSGHPKYSSHKTLIEGSPYREVRGIEDADFIYVGVPHIGGEDQTDPMKFQEEIKRLVDSRLPMLCANPDLFAHEGNPPRAVVRQGSIARMYEEAGGDVFYVGKPYAEAYRVAMKEFHLYGIDNPTDILMVGDTPETDIRGAKAFGMASALVTESGMMAERIDYLGFEKAFERLRATDIPDYFIEGLKSDL